MKASAAMKRSLLIFALASLTSIAAVRAADTSATAQATAASSEWLAVIDAGEYGKSWDAAAAVLRQNITKPQWERAAGAVRKQTGALKSRELQSAQPAHELPGVPAGDYVVLTYRSSFADAPTATETVTPMREADGTWRVAGYYIK
jgi:hypothetical protein